MESYGKLVGGRLQLVSDANACLLGADEVAVQKPAGTKQIKYAALPAFDQLTEYVYQTAPVDGKTSITVGVAVGKCAVDSQIDGGMETIDLPVSGPTSFKEA